MTLRAGVAVRDITPESPLFLVGYPHVPRTSTGVHDPLTASALCLRNGEDAVVMAAVDILFIDPPTARRIRREVSERTGVAEDAVFVSCTHTHSGPVTSVMLSWRADAVVPDPDPAYMERFIEGVVGAAADAAANLFDAEMAVTTADASGAGGNRLDPNGATDPEAGVLVVRECSGPVRAVSMTYSMHPTVLHEDSKLVSADFPHYARETLREGLGAETAVLYHTGPSGNQSPRRVVRAQTFEEAERLGRMVGEPVLAAVRDCSDDAFDRDPALAAAVAPVELMRRKLPSVEDAERLHAEALAEYERLRTACADRAEIRTAECATFGSEETVVLARAEAAGEIDAFLERYEPFETQVVRVGETYWVGFPCELFVEYGLMLKHMAGPRVVPVSLVNGETQGYVVTPEAAGVGGYEAANALFEPESGSALVEAALDLVASLSAR